MVSGLSQLPIFGQGLMEGGPVPRITSLLIKPASAVCNLDCAYCFYLDRDADPYSALPGAPHDAGDAGAPGGYLSLLLVPQQRVRVSGRRADAGRVCRFSKSWSSSSSSTAATASRSAMRCRPTASLLDKNWCNLFREYQLAAGRLAGRAGGDQRPLPLQQGEARHLEARDAEHRDCCRRTKWSSTFCAC